jgi:FtsP/CotA-like multicopper oxidase with cupredoxin domain
MSSGARIGLVLGTVVAIVVAFVLLSPGGDGSKPASTAPTGTAALTTTIEPRPATGGTPATADLEPAQPAFTTIRVENGKPAGGVRTITVNKGDRVRIEVRSPDTSDEIHLHGYDLKRDLKAGGRVRFSFDGGVEGIFEIELESAGTQIGKLVVEP